MNFSHPTKRPKKSGESFRRDARLLADGGRHPDNPPHGGHRGCVSNLRASTTIASNSTSPHEQNLIVLDGDDPLPSSPDEVQVIIPPKPNQCPVTDEVFTIELRTRIRAKLNKNHVSNDPLTYNKEMLRDSMVEPLVQLKGYLITKTRAGINSSRQHRTII